MHKKRQAKGENLFVITEGSHLEAGAVVAPRKRFFYHMLIGYKDSIGKRGAIVAVAKTGYWACIGLGAQSLGFAKVGDQRILGANADIIFDI